MSDTKDPSDTTSVIPLDVLRKEASDSTAVRGGAANLKPFQPGVSGNPSGMSAEKAELRRYLATFGRESIDGILEMARHAQSPKIRLAAYTWVAEQVIGRAVVAISGEDGKPLQVDVGIVSVLRRLAGESEGG